MTITTTSLAYLIADRLNDMLQTQGAAEAFEHLIEQRVPVSAAVREHPTLQCIDTQAGPSTLGVLGLLNGLIGVRADSTGFLAAEYNDAGELTNFIVREEENEP